MGKAGEIPGLFDPPLEFSKNFKGEFEPAWLYNRNIGS